MPRRHILILQRMGVRDYPVDDQCASSLSEKYKPLDIITLNRRTCLHLAQPCPKVHRELTRSCSTAIEVLMLEDR